MYNVKRTPSHRQESLPPVSILRPLKGIDFQLEENLAASFLQEYPNFEVILTVASASDPVIAIARQMMEAYPHVPSKLCIGEACVGVNPKINNLHVAFTDAVKGASYDLVWVLDSNCRPAKEALWRAVAFHHHEHQSKRMSVIHQAPFPLYPQTFGARLEQLFLGTVHTRMYTVINWTGLASCLNGKSNIYRKSDLARATGSNGSLAPFGAYLAEDNLVGEAMMRHIGPHQLSPDPAWQPLGEMSLSAYFSRRIRWTRIRKHNVTLATIIEPFTECLVAGWYGSWLLAHAFPILSTYRIYLFALHVFVWFLVDVVVFKSVMNVAYETGVVSREENPDDIWGTWWQWSLAWCVRELTALPVWVWAVLGMHVEWRGQWFQLHLDGTATPLCSSKQAPILRKETSTENGSRDEVANLMVKK